MSDATKLYRYYDSAGTLLYIGISKNALQRLTEHETDKSWQADISNVRIETFRDRASAHAAERLAIAEENPSHNLIRYASRSAAREQRDGSRRDRARRTKEAPRAINDRCLAALTSMYEEMHWNDFLFAYSHTGGELVALAFNRTDRIEALSEQWMCDAKYTFEYGGMRIAATYRALDDRIEIDLLRQRCSGAEIAEFDLKKHDAIHEELCADAPLDEARRPSIDLD
jgi:predicted GIY-YIG superfamily endonuclease